MTIGEWLQKNRKKKRLTQLELANKSKVSQPQIHNIEQGKTKNPHEDTRKKLEKFFGEKIPPAVVKAEIEEEKIEGLGSLEGFDPHDAESLPNVTGVYVFYDSTDRPVYVGSTTRSISVRVQEHYEKFWFKRPIVDRGAFLKIADEKIMKEMENVLIKFLGSNALFNVKGTYRD